MLYIKLITLIILSFYVKRISLHCVFHGIRLFRLREIGCRETINFLFYIHPILKYIFGSINYYLNIFLNDTGMGVSNSMHSPVIG